MKNNKSKEETLDDGGSVGMAGVFIPKERGRRAMLIRSRCLDER